MELFVVNRHEGDDPNVVTNGDDQQKLDKVLSRIERNKKIRLRQKEREAKVKEVKLKTRQARQAKREFKAKIIPVPENEVDDFIDKSIIEGEATEVKPKIKKQKLNEITDVEGFTILGATNFDKKQKVKRVLPKWLSNPTVISRDLQELQTKISDIKQLDKATRKLLKANGIKYFFPVQAEVIPWLIEANKLSDVVFPRDICVSAPTGSGKTLAFALPVIQTLKRHTTRRIRALVILPTQDLAVQVFKTFKTYTQNTTLAVGLISGQNTFAMEQVQLVSENEAFGFVSKVDILVCTAGRLVDHLKETKGFNLQHLQFLIIDEADRVLETVQNDWLYHLEKHIHANDPTAPSSVILNLFTLQKRRPPQKLLFSATLSQDPEKLQKLSLFQPKLFTSVMADSQDHTESLNTFVGKYTTPKELTEKYIVTSIDLKPLVLYKFIHKEALTKTIIFTHSIESAHRLMILLKSLFKSTMKIEQISSNLQSRNRTELINKFSNGEIDLLVCTDSLARGMDLPGVQCVISYSAPKHLETYIHRAGRTARAGENGLAVTLLHKSQVTQFNSLLKQADKTNVEEMKIAEDDLEPLGKQYKEALAELKRTVVKEGKSNLKKTKLAKKPRVANKRKKVNSISQNGV